MGPHVFLGSTLSGVDEVVRVVQPPSCDLKGTQPPNSVKFSWKEEHRRVIILL